MVQVSVIIVNYNTKQMTNECIESIIAYTNGLNYEIILVDNGSSDGSKEFFEKKEGIVYIYSNENLGFGRANNLGAEKATGNYLFLLNSDTLLFDNSIKKMLDFFTLNQNVLKIGALGCILIDDNKSMINSGGFFPCSKNYIKSFFRIPVPIFSISLKEEYQLIDFVTGADLMIDKDLFKKIGGFDENFFLYYEETDLQKRIADLGYQNYLLTTTNIIHLEGGSDLGGKTSNFKRIVIHESRNRYLSKHDKKYYKKYVIVDFFMNIARFIISDYTLKEKITFFKANLKSY